MKDEYEAGTLADRGEELVDGAKRFVRQAAVVRTLLDIEDRKMSQAKVDSLRSVSAELRSAQEAIEKLIPAVPSDPNDEFKELATQWEGNHAAQAAGREA